MMESGGQRDEMADREERIGEERIGEGLTSSRINACGVTSSGRYYRQSVLNGSLETLRFQLCKLVAKATTAQVLRL